MISRFKPAIRTVGDNDTVPSRFSRLIFDGSVRTNRDARDQGKTREEPSKEVAKVPIDKDELVQEIGSLLLNDPEISSREWSHLVIVAQLRDLSTKVNGFAYHEDGEAVPTGPRNSKVLDKFEELSEAMREAGKDSWKACLVRIDRSSKDVSIDFEYDHPGKWLIVPSTVRQMAETLRPVQP
jgi:hypothetical protein